MKKVLYGLGLVVFLFIVGLVGEWETHYSMLATCVETDWINNIATFVDNRGNEWEWELDLDSWFIKENCAYRLCMSDNHTTSIYDDYIRKIKEN